MHFKISVISEHSVANGAEESGVRYCRSVSRHMKDKSVLREKLLLALLAVLDRPGYFGIFVRGPMLGQFRRRLENQIAFLAFCVVNGHVPSQSVLPGEIPDALRTFVFE